MSIVLGESQRDVRARPYFRGWAVCSRVDIGIDSVLASQHPAWRDATHRQPRLAGRNTIRANCVRLSLAACRPEERVRVTDRAGRTKRLQGRGSASPEMTSRSQAWTAPTTSSGPGIARGVAEPAIQSEITVMRARNWPSASTEARMTKILVRRAGLASLGICRSSASEHH